MIPVDYNNKVQTLSCMAIDRLLNYIQIYAYGAVRHGRSHFSANWLSTQKHTGYDLKNANNKTTRSTTERRKIEKRNLDPLAYWTPFWTPP